MAARRHREAVRSRPGVGQGAQRRDPEDAAGTSDLSNGPFPRQGDGPEHHGAALRQRPVRAAVESPAYRPRPDHRLGDGRRRTARQVLRADRRAARHGAQSHVPVAVVDGNGAADLLRRRGGPRQEGGSHPGHTSGLAQARDEGRRARPVRCRHRSGQAGPGLSQRAQRCPRFEHRDLHRLEAADRQLALGRGALLPAHGKVSQAALDRSRHPLPPGALHAFPRHACGADESQLDDPAHPARRRHRAPVRRQASRPHGDAGQRQHGLRLQDLFRLGAQYGLRNADL